MKMLKNNQLFKNFLCVLFVVFICLITISSVSADVDFEENFNDDMNSVSDIAIDQSKDVSYVSDWNYYITSDLSNSDIQNMLDNAIDGTTFEFTDKTYDGISLVINKPVNIISNVNSTIYTSDKIGDYGFYFTKASAGSVLSGFIIKAENNNPVVVEGSDILIANNTIVGGNNGLIIKGTNNVTVFGNNISNEKVNGIQVIDAVGTNIIANNISYNTRSGIELSSASNSTITGNYIFRNKFNGITFYGSTSGNLLTFNYIFRNMNGVYIDSESKGDVISFNTIYDNRKNPSSELGGYETGNGILFGPNYETLSKKQVVISYNYLAHNENFGVKNNPSNSVMKIEPNYYDSTDDSNTFICPLLLGKILTMDFSVKNDVLSFQVQEDGSPVDKMANFEIQVKVDNQVQTVTVENGKANIQLDPTQDHEIEYKIGDKTYKQTVKASQTSNENEDAGGEKTDDDEIDESVSNQTTSTDSVGTSSNSGTGTGAASTTITSNITSSSSSQLANGTTQSSSGTNTSDIYEEKGSNQGETPITGEESYSASSDSAGGEKGKSNSYELSIPEKTSKAITDNSAIVAIAIIAIVIIFAVGYKRKNDVD